MGNKFNYPVGSIKIIQHRDNEEDYIMNGITYKYYKPTLLEKIRGERKNYFNSGFYYEVDIKNVNNFYTQINILPDWLNGAKEVIMSGIIYNINVDIYISFMFLFESVGAGNVYKRFFKRDIANLNPKQDNLLIPIVILEITLFIFIIFILICRRQSLVSQYLNTETTNSLNLSKLTNSSYPKNKCSNRIKQYIDFPNLFELFGIINIGYCIYCSIMLSQYIKESKSLNLQDDLQIFLKKINLITILFSSNIFLFLFGIINVIINYVFDLHIMTNAIVSYVKQTLRIFLTYMVPFLGISFFVYKFSASNYPFLHYLQYSFLYTKILGMLMKGTLNDEKNEELSKRGKVYEFFKDSQNKFTGFNKSTGNLFFYFVS